VKAPAGRSPCVECWLHLELTVSLAVVVPANGDIAPIVQDKIR
jgi:hypothetical protein